MKTQSVLAAVVLLAGCAPLPDRVVTEIANLPVVSAGYYTTCVLRSDRSVDCFGATPGDGTVLVPHKDAFQLRAPGQAIKVDLSESSTEFAACVINNDGSASVSCWTKSLNGAKPFDIPGVTGATDIAVAANDACAVVANGGVECWHMYSPAPTLRQDVGSAKAIAAGYDHYCVIKTDNSVACWGKNGSGQLGVSAGVGTSNDMPATVVPGIQAKWISAGFYHTCAADTAGNVACWGSNNYGQLGNGTKNITPNPTPQYVSGLDGVTLVSAGYQFSCAVRWNHAVLCWGENDQGQLGNGQTTDSYTPVSVSNLADMIFVSGGSDHTCASGLGLKVRCWGKNTSGQLADGTQMDALVPAP